MGWGDLLLPSLPACSYGRILNSLFIRPLEMRHRGLIGAGPTTPPETDGGPWGSPPYGVFITQGGMDDTGTQKIKLVHWHLIIGPVGTTGVTREFSLSLQ
jgi:hypothetical protein